MFLKSSKLYHAINFIRISCLRPPPKIVELFLLKKQMHLLSLSLIYQQIGPPPWFPNPAPNPPRLPPPRSPSSSSLLRR